MGWSSRDAQRQGVVYGSPRLRGRGSIDRDPGGRFPWGSVAAVVLLALVGAAFVFALPRAAPAESPVTGAASGSPTAAPSASAVALSPDASPSPDAVPASPTLVPGASGYAGPGASPTFVPIPGDSVVVRVDATISSAWLKVWVDGVPSPEYGRGRVLRRGQSVEFRGTDSVEIRTGNSGATAFTVNAVSLGTLGRTGFAETWLFDPPSEPRRTSRR